VSRPSGFRGAATEHGCRTGRPPEGPNRFIVYVIPEGAFRVKGVGVAESDCRREPTCGFGLAVAGAGRAGPESGVKVERPERSEDERP